MPNAVRPTAKQMACVRDLKNQVTAEAYEEAVKAVYGRNLWGGLERIPTMAGHRSLIHLLQREVEVK